MAHLKKKDGNKQRYLYRVFYDDCASLKRRVYHPLRKCNVELGETETNTNTNTNT